MSSSSLPADARSRMAVLGAAVMSSMAKQAAAATTNEDMETALRALYDATDGPNWTNKVSVLSEQRGCDAAHGARAACRWRKRCATDVRDVLERVFSHLTMHVCTCSRRF